MKHSLMTILLAAGMAALTGCGSDSDNKNTPAAVEDPKTQTPDSTPATFSSLNLQVIGRYVSGNAFDTSSAEIVSYDQTSDRLYVVNAQDKSIDVLSFTHKASPLNKVILIYKQRQNMRILILARLIQWWQKTV